MMFETIASSIACTLPAHSSNHQSSNQSSQMHIEPAETDRLLIPLPNHKGPNVALHPTRAKPSSCCSPDEAAVKKLLRVTSDCTPTHLGLMQDLTYIRSFERHLLHTHTIRQSAMLTGAKFTPIIHRYTYTYIYTYMYIRVVRPSTKMVHAPIRCMRQIGAFANCIKLAHEESFQDDDEDTALSYQHDNIETGFGFQDHDEFGGISLLTYRIRRGRLV